LVGGRCVWVKGRGYELREAPVNNGFDGDVDEFAWDVAWYVNSSIIENVEREENSGIEPGDDLYCLWPKREVFWFKGTCFSLILDGLSSGSRL